MGPDPKRRDRLARGLKHARYSAGLTSTEALEKLRAAGIHCTRDQLYAWERGTGNDPAASDLPILAGVYGCTIERLFNPPRGRMPSIPKRPPPKKRPPKKKK